jgi:uncharacterized protein (TIGR02646 family)
MPACLRNPPADHSYGSLRAADRGQIRTALHAIQGARCAYCERRTGIEVGDGHIEHFRCQTDHPNLDLDWSNLFWSCNDENSCGKFKDGCVRGGGHRARFNPADLIDPSVDDPDAFLLFVTDGTVQLQAGLDDADVRRAQETLRVFNLAASAYLRKAREDAVRAYLRHVQWMQDHAPALLPDYVAEAQAEAAGAPFSAVVRHFFRDFV